MTRQTKQAEKKVNLEEVLPPREWELLNMLAYRRPAWSKTEDAFIEKYIKPLGTEEDAAHNHWLTIGDNSPILWSCHTDTVHKVAGLQKVMISLDDKSVFADNSNCLGADDGVGVWIMMNMIRAKVPGTYVFHAGEEIGGVGSEWAAEHMLDRLKGLNFAVAFDRKGTDEIITHQMAGRTASEKFAASMAECLKPLGYGPSDGGTFTDTANYSTLISECTNLGVGYYNQHTSKEFLDMGHATALLDQLIAADFSTLVYARDPTVVERKTYSYYSGAGYGGHNKYGGIYTGDDEGYEHWWEKAAHEDGADVTKTGNDNADSGLNRFIGGGVKQIAHQTKTTSRFDLVDYVREYPEDIAELMQLMGMTVEEVEDYLFNAYDVER